ncbi:MAG: PIN domain-containing protein [Rhodobacteraceae bacterium]|nr:PIN domain-containing protein [Paracoccaceae bacterium]
MLSSTVEKEVRSHLVAHTENIVGEARHKIGKVLAAFETSTPTLDAIIDQLTNNQKPEEAACKRLDGFLKESKCEVVKDSIFVSVDALFSSYFERNPPFATGKKKHEFPDALALNSLEGKAAEDGIGILVVSNDKGWRSFCENSSALYWMSDITRALSLVTAAPTGLRQAVVSWLAGDGEGHQVVREHIEYNVEDIVFDVNGYPTFGEMEIIPSGGHLSDITWPPDEQVDIVRFSPVGDNEFEVVASVPAILFIRAHVELNFSVWDNVDQDSISFGGREEEIDCDFDVRVSITLHVSGETEDQSVTFQDSKIDPQSFYIELGQVDVLEPEDWGPEDHWNESDIEEGDDF